MKSSIGPPSQGRFSEPLAADGAPYVAAAVRSSRSWLFSSAGSCSVYKQLRSVHQSFLTISCLFWLFCAVGGPGRLQVFYRQGWGTSAGDGGVQHPWSHREVFVMSRGRDAHPASPST